MYYRNRLDAPSLPGLSVFGTLQDWIEKLGEPTSIKASEDELRRTYSFAKYNTVVQFQQGAITGLGIFDASLGTFDFTHEKM